MGEDFITQCEILVLLNLPEDVSGAGLSLKATDFVLAVGHTGPGGQ
jgi:hypothetical protein